MLSEFHARDGLYFARFSDGSVMVSIKQVINEEGRRVLWEKEVIRLDANTWASAVASVCARGESAETSAGALAFHGRPVVEERT